VGNVATATERPPGTGLFDPQTGALAQNAGDPSTGAHGTGNLSSDVPTQPTSGQMAQWASMTPVGRGAAGAKATAEAGWLTRAWNASSKWLRGLFGSGARGAENLAVTFGRNANQIEHAFRHTDKLGLSRTAVQDAIQKHLPSVADKIPSGAPLNAVIDVGGKRIQYSAFRLPDGSINVGRIHGVP
jgi:hypothetical protein